MQFTARTDHKPLVHIFSSTNKITTPRIERLVLRSMPYKFDTQYHPGIIHNVADFLSRSNPILESPVKWNTAEDYVNYIFKIVLPVSISIDRICKEQQKDSNILNAINSLATGTPISTFYTIRQRLSLIQGVLLFRNRIVILSSWKSALIDIAHEGHQTTTKQRLRQTVWWPGLNKDVDEFIQCCHGCQVVGLMPTKTPLSTTPIPDDAWLMVGCDIGGLWHLWPISYWRELVGLRWLS